MIIPKELFKNDTVYRYCGGSSNNGIVSCGFLNKKGESNDVNLNFKFYGGLLILNGTGKHIDKNGNESPLYPGCFVQRLPGRLHSTIVDKGSNWLEFFICIGAELYESFKNITLLNDDDILYPGVNPYILKKFTALLDNMKKTNDVNISNLLLESLNIIFYIYEKDKLRQFETTETATINKVTEILMENAFSRQTVEEQTSNLGISYDYIRKLFKKYNGISPRQYQISLRINHAQQMIAGGNHSIKNVALETGYSDTYAFSKQFKQITGLSPTEFINTL